MDEGRAAWFAGLIVAGLLAGCAPVGDAEAPFLAAEPVRAAFRCEGGERIAVTFAGDHAALESSGGSARLRAQPAGSGIHYAGEGHDLRGKGAGATWTDPSGRARDCREVSTEGGRDEPGTPSVSPSLAGSVWRLVHFQSSDDAIGTVVPPRVERYTLHFLGDGALVLGLDCNRGTARWTSQPGSATGGGLTVTPGVMTRAMCGAGAIDTRLARDLQWVRSYTIADGWLHLALAADAGFYVWEPAVQESR